MDHRPRSMALLLVVLALAVAACRSEPTSESRGGGGGPGEKTIVIQDFTFDPLMLSAKVGDTITVVNKDSALHTLTARDSSFDTGTFAATSRMITLEEAGRFPFHCTVHPFMPEGLITVSD